MAPRRIRLKSGFALGDVVALTGAVREIHEQYPAQFLMDVDTSAMELWWHNPYITTLHSDAEIIDCGAVTIDRSGASGRHYIGAYLDLLNQRLGTNATLRRVAGDIHLSAEEKDWYSDIWSLCNDEIPYWIICPGGKFDLPIKWWSTERYQEVVDHFRGRIQFVQVGTWGNFHPKLEGAIDLRGKTGIRDLVHLMYYAQGVICGVTSLMHLAAAVPTESGKSRQAIIVAGAREPQVWEKYPGHDFLSSEELVGCRHCWKHRHLSLPDRGQNYSTDIRCDETSNYLPRCMDLISSEQIIGLLHSKLTAGTIAELSTSQRCSAEIALVTSEAQNDFDEHNIHPLNSVAKAERYIARIPAYQHGRFEGRGIVLCGGGMNYFTNAWICVNILRFHGCKLPVELWYLGRRELDRRMEALMSPLGVTCINARQVMNRHPLRNPLGWELKSYALLHSRFREVLLLDADNVAVRNPESLFDSPEYDETGAIFWPDYRRLGPRRAIWKVCGVKYRDEPEFESGQMVINKERCWAPVNLSFWYNNHSEFFYQYIHGDKETFHMAWRKLDAPYSMVPYPIQPLKGTMCQHDFEGRWLFQHRNLLKWKLWGPNPHVPGFQFESECLRYLAVLREVWDGRIHQKSESFSRFGFSFRKGTFDEAIFLNVTRANEYALPQTFAPADTIIDIGAHIGSFAAACHSRGSRSVYCFEANQENAKLARRNLKTLRGVTVVNRAVLHHEIPVAVGPFPVHENGLNTGGSTVRPVTFGVTRAVSLDRLLRKHETVRMLKLDCEGSEWPILLGSQELWRVYELCGEYHELAQHPLCPGVAKFDRHLLRRVLKQNFKKVKTLLDRTNPKLGKFWASEPRPRSLHVAQFGELIRSRRGTPAQAQGDAA